MKKRLFPLLAMLLLLAACAAPPATAELPALPAGTPVPVSAPTVDPESPAAPSVEHDPPAADPLAYDDLPGGTPFANESGYANMRLVLPAGWQGEPVESDENGSFGIDFWREDEPEYRLELRYRPERIGLCGTGLISEELTYGGLSAVRIRYSDLSAWTLWIFRNTPGEYTLETDAPNRWVDTHVKELDGILGSLVLGEGAIRPDEAERIARSALTEDYESCIVSFDCWSGLFTVRFWNTDVHEEKSVTVDYAGTLTQE